VRKKLANARLCGRVSPQANIEPSAGDASNGPANSNGHPHTKNETDIPLRESSPKHRALLARRVELAVAQKNAVPIAKFDIADVAWLYKETMARLNYYQKRVNEGKDLEAAHDFCGYVFQADLQKLFRLSGAGGFADADAMNAKRKELEYQIHEMWRTCKVIKRYDEGAVEALNRKVDMLLEALSKQGELPPNVVRLLGPSKE